MKLTGVEFTNSPSCHGTAFAAGDAPLDIAEISINGRYPEQGWAQNHESHEMVRVLRGTGSLSLKDDTTIPLTEGDVVHVPPKTWFAWDGTMTIIMACSPVFTPDQYEIKED